MSLEHLTRREAKRLALADVAELARSMPMTLGMDEHDRRLYAAAIEEVADEVQRRADRYLQDVTPRKPRTPDLDELLCRLRDLGVDQETVIRSLARRHRHGRHWISWVHPDGSKGTAEGSTAVIAAGRAVKATERRLKPRSSRRAA